MKRIERSHYLERLKQLRDHKVIKIITGVRRCGKSTLMEIFQDYLRSDGVEASRIIAVNFEDYEMRSLLDPDELYRYVKERLQSGVMNYVFFDEIQQVRDFQHVLDGLFIRPDVDLYVTGSNAYLLSGELATYISGRYVELAMLPFSFAEYVEATSAPGRTLQAAYADYVQHGAFPYSVTLQDLPDAWHDYMEGLYNTIVLKDIVQRHKVSDTMMLESVIRYLLNNVGNTSSTKSIADTMTSSGRKIDVKTVEKYLTALRQSYVVYTAQRYNVRGRELLKTMEKHYMVDLGFRRLLLGRRAQDVGHLLENVVYLELLRRHREVYIGKVDALEVDFVVNGTDGTQYYQVAATVRDPQTLQRELASLRAVRDQYPKYLLTLDEDPTADYDGIIRLNALCWLMGET